VPAAVAAETEFKIEIIGERCDARRLEVAPYDPAGSRMRG
jgi:hypothetical protein